MGPWGRHCAAVALAALTALGPADGALARDTVRSCGPSDSCARLEPVHLTAGRATLDLPGFTLRHLSARAVDPATRRPVRGLPLRFTTADGRLLGEARTGRDGVAVTDATGPGVVRTLLSGYRAVLVGDGAHVPAEARGTVVLGTRTRDRGAPEAAR
jgi:hypothetical protein